MKKIGIIFSTREELDELLKIVKINKETTYYDITFYECFINNNRCILVESGIGKVNAGRATQLLIDKINPDYIINVGVAGSTSKNIYLKDIVVGTKMVNYDFDITEFNHEIGFIPGIGVYINNSNDLSNICRSFNEKDVHFGVIASGDRFLTDKEESEKISRTFNSLCVEMEGSAVSQVCFLCAVPCLVIRGISDTIYKGNSKESYEALLSEVSIKVCEFLLKLLGRIK